MSRRFKGLAGYAGALTIVVGAFALYVTIALIPWVLGAAFLKAVL